MPNCFQLIDRQTGQAEILNRIDEKLCKAMGVPCDPVKWYLDWYDIAGFQIALGKDLPAQIVKGREWIAANPTDNHAIDFLEVLIWLDQHYTSDAWVEIGKRE